MQSFRLDSQIALVTSASTGLGAAIAVALAEAGADVAVHDTAQPPGETCARVRQTGRRAVPITGDLSDPSEPARLVADALGLLDPGFTCLAIETEFWGAMASPNLMVESTTDDLAEMLTALSFHVGEVQRNPYHLLLPAWMQDNVRRGGELVGGQGGAAPDFTFCTLYRFRRWTGGLLEKTYEGGRSLPAESPAAALLDW